MNLASWITQRQGEWKRLELLLDQVENSGLRTLNDAEAVDFARLYRRTASDLNQAQTFVQGDSTVKYLNDLVARCYVAIHARTKIDWLGWLSQLFWGYPVHFRRHLKQMSLATLILAAGAVFGFLASYYDGPRARALMFPNMPMIQPGQERHLAGSGELAGFSSFLFTNNTKVCLITCALGLTWGIGTALLLWYNGMMMGALGAVFLEAGEFQAYCTGILPHGVLEIPAALISGAAGFVLAEALIRVRPWPRLQELGRAGTEALWLVAGCFPLMAVAALLEAGVARAPDWFLDSGIKLAVAGLFGLLFLAYLLLVGWGTKTAREQG
jgi:uncharacterized membrane protein SpoIIM required for sporulation